MRTSSIVTVAAVATVLLLAGSIAPAFADTWVYPGAANCTLQTAETGSRTTGGDSTQHRAEGYGGYYYASWEPTWWEQTRVKEWGWYQILSSRVGTTGSGGVVNGGWVGC